MKDLLGLVASFLILAISLIHFYWAFGGKKWAGIVLPKQANTDKLVFKAGSWATVVAALMFGAFAAAIAMKTFLPVSRIPIQWLDLGVWLIGGAFLLRALGDFKYVGFSKKIHSTDFAVYDTKIYTPLSLVIGLIIITIALL